MPISLTDSKDTLVLRVKYHKVTLFLPCRPTTELSAIKSQFLSAVQQTNQTELSMLPQYNTADGKSYPGWSEMDAAEDIGLFVPGNTADESGALEGMTIYMPIDRDAGRAEATVSKAGLKEADVICIGFRARGASSISQPVVQFTDHEEEEQEQENGAEDEDSNAITPPPYTS